MSAYVSGSTGNADSSSTTSHSIDLPGSAAVGDKIIVAIGIDSASTAFTFPAGWDVHFDDEDIVSTGTAAVYSKEYESGDTWPITVTTDVSERAAWMVQSIRDWGTLGGVSASVGTGTGTTATIPDYTTGADDELVFAIVVTDQVSGAHSTISGYSNQDTFGGASAATVSMQSKVVASASTTETGNTVTWGTSQEWVAMVVAFNSGATSLSRTIATVDDSTVALQAYAEKFIYPTIETIDDSAVSLEATAYTDISRVLSVMDDSAVELSALAITEILPTISVVEDSAVAMYQVASIDVNSASRTALSARLAASKSSVILPDAPRLAGAKIANGL